jgi:hypothetical protein
MTRSILIGCPINFKWYRESQFVNIHFLSFHRSYLHDVRVCVGRPQSTHVMLVSTRGRPGGVGMYQTHLSGAFCHLGPRIGPRWVKVFSSEKGAWVAVRHTLTLRIVAPHSNPLYVLLSFAVHPPGAGCRSWKNRGPVGRLDWGDGQTRHRSISCGLADPRSHSLW